MSAFFSRFSAVLLCLFICAIPFPKAANAAITVEDRQLVSKRRVGRSAFKYTYKITVKAEGPAVENAVVFVTCDNAGTTVLGEMFRGELMADTGVVELGNLAGDTTILSDDTFTIRQNRRIPFDPDCLVYDIAYESTVVLSGVVTDNPLSNANVKIIVDYREAGRPIIEAFSDPDAGRPIIETFNTVADAEGNYEVEVSVGAQDGFVTVTGDGTTADQEGAQLTSNLGSVGGLHTGGLPGSIVVGGEDVTHITTALAVLAEQAAGGEILSDEDLQAFEAQVPGDDLINLAAAIKTVVDNPDIDIPDGGMGCDFLCFLSDPEVTEEFVAETMEEPEFAAAFMETVADLPLVYDEAELDDTELYTNVITNNPLIISGNAFEFDAGGTGKVINFNGSSTTVWFVNGDGDLVIEPDSLIRIAFPFCDTGAGQEQREQQNITEEIKLIRIIEGVASDQVFQVQRTRIVWHADCDLPDEVIVGEPDPAFVRFAINTSQIIPVDPVDLVDGPFVLEFLNVDNDNDSTNDPRFGADFVNFIADGTGSFQRTGYEFTWSIDGAGRLNVLFSNGDINQFVVFAEDEGPITRTVLIADLTDDTAGPAEKATSGLAVDPDGMSALTDAVLENHQFRNLFSVLRGGSFDFFFEDDGTGCRLFEIFNNPTEWVSVDDRVEITRFFGFDPSIIFRVRTWEGAATVIGTFGDRIWLIENFNTNLDQNPVFDPSPETEVGRVNAYEDLGDFTGNSPPVTVDNLEATTVDMAITFDPSTNDMDADADDVFMSFSDNGSDNGGTIVQNFNADFTRLISLTYTPPLGMDDFQDRFSYFVTDLSNCALVEGEVFIDVGDPP